MAELNACCSSDAEATCCDPADKSVCCDDAAHASGTCGCDAGRAPTGVRDAVRSRYAAAATAVTAVIADDQADVFGRALYADDDQAELPDAGVVDVEFHETHRVHGARKPA